MEGETKHGSITLAGPDALQGYSRALYANWLWYRRQHLLIDAGEGVALALGNHVFSPRIVALTHGHSDHLLGLPGLAAARRFGKGATAAPWTVLYPDGVGGVDTIRQTIDSLWQDVHFPIAWTPITPGTLHPLGLNRALEAFAVTHVPGELAVGYRVLETRTRLKPEFRDLPATQIAHLSRTRGRDALTERYAHIVLVHSGDAMPIAPALTLEADLLVHDATFVTPGERREPIHAAADEVMELAAAARVRTLVLQHLSVRYERPAVYDTLRGMVAASGFTGVCWLLDDHRFIDLRV